MQDGRELGGFLQSRRALVSPERAGVQGGSRRRVPGLRREEVALLAGISVEYYVRLEQGRAARPSEEVLDAVARALDLDAVEGAHLRDLARPRRRRAHRTAWAERARPELARLLTAMDHVPALVMNHRLDVLAWNRLAEQLYYGFDATTPRAWNLARFAFLQAASRDLFGDWDEVAEATVGQLRLGAGRHPADEALAALVGELSINSEAFRVLWAGRSVKERAHGRKHFRHPLVGELTLRYENFELAGGSGQRLVTFSADPDSPAQTALRLLATWTAPHESPPDRRVTPGPRRSLTKWPWSNPRRARRARGQRGVGQRGGGRDHAGRRGARAGRDPARPIGGMDQGLGMMTRL